MKLVNSIPPPFNRAICNKNWEKIVIPNLPPLRPRFLLQTNTSWAPKENVEWTDELTVHLINLCQEHVLYKVTYVEYPVKV